MTTTETLSTERPIPHLRDYLTAGGTFTDYTADHMITNICDIGMMDMSDPDEVALRARRVEMRRKWANDPINDEEDARLYAWEADYAEAHPDPELERLVEEALGLRGGVKLDQTRMEYQRPYPLSVTSPGRSWNCSNCGAHGTRTTPAVVITAPHGHLGDDLPIYCVACVTALVTAAAAPEDDSLRRSAGDVPPKMPSSPNSIA